jgi:hypothetical protein
MPAVKTRNARKRQINFTLPLHIDALVRMDAAGRRVRNSHVAAEILAAHYGVPVEPIAKGPADDADADFDFGPRQP